MNHFWRFNNPNRYSDLSLLIAVSGTAIYFGAGFFDFYLFGFLGFVLWFGGTGFFSYKITKSFIRDNIGSLLLTPLLVFFVFGFFLGAINSFLFLNYLAVVFCLLIALVFLVFFDNVIGAPFILEQKNILDENNNKNNNDNKSTYLNFIFFIITLFLTSVGFYFLVTSISTAKVFNPWLHLPLGYLLVCLVLFMFNLSFILFSKIDRKLIIMAIVLISFLVHGYLLVAGEGFNADRFRHLGSQYRLAENINQVDPELKAADWSKREQILGFSVYNPLVNLSQFSYSFQWSLVAFLSSILRIDVYVIDLYFGWVLASFFLPLLFYVGAKFIFNSEAFALLTAQLSFLPYILIYYGAQTLPAVFGFLFFLLVLVFILSLFNDYNRKRVYFIITLISLSFFSYVMAFILSLILLFSFVVWHKEKFFLVPLIFIIFIIDFISTYSFFNSNILFRKFLPVIDNFFDLNVLFFADRWFLDQSSDWLVLFWRLLSVFLYLLIIISLVIIFKKYKNDIINYLIFIFFLLLMNFLLGVFFLDGLLIMTRRINVFLGVILVFLISIIVFKLLESRPNFRLPAIIFLSLIFTLSFVSGPITSFAVSGSEIKIARVLAERINQDWNDYCILAETTILLPLESFTLREIAGGNFPIDNNHQQPGLNRLLREIKLDFNQQIFADILQVSGKKKCFVVLNEEFLSEAKVNYISYFMGEAELIDNNYLWLIKYEK
jgi:hypothetical protein